MRTEAKPRKDSAPARPFSNPSQANATAPLSPPTAPLPLSDSSLEEYSLGSSFGTVSGRRMQESIKSARNSKKMWVLMLSPWPRASFSLSGSFTHKMRGQSGSPRGRLSLPPSDATHIQRPRVGVTQSRVRSV